MCAPPCMSALPVMEVLLGGLLGVAAAAAVQAASNRDEEVQQAASNRDPAVPQTASNRDEEVQQAARNREHAVLQTAGNRERAVQQLLEFFQLQGRIYLWEEIVRDKQRRKMLGRIGDAALMCYVLEQLIARNVDNSEDLHFRSQTVSEMLTPWNRPDSATCMES